MAPSCARAGCGAAAPASAAASAASFNVAVVLDTLSLPSCTPARRSAGPDPCVVALRQRWRPPRQQALLDDAHQCLGAQRQQLDHQHRAEHAVGVEGVLRRGDHQTEAVLGAQELADDSADDGEPERDVQAGDDPGHRRGDHHVAHHLQPRRAEHADVGDQVAVDAAHPLERVEEHHEEHQHGGQQHLRRQSQPEPHHEDRAEHDARQGVDDLDVRPGHVGQERDLAQQHADHDPADHAAGEAEQRLLQRDPDLQPERP